MIRYKQNRYWCFQMKSIAVVFHESDEVLVKPSEMIHLSCDIQLLIDRIRFLEGKFQYIGYSYEKVAYEVGLQDFCQCCESTFHISFQDKGNSFRRARSDKSGSLKMVPYTLGR